MTLTPVRLDDLAWLGMVDAVRTRIAAASSELWSLHAPVDPGVTLLELYAYQLEQRVYMVDQTPDALVHALLAVLGEEPLPARPATTVIELYARGAGAIAELPEQAALERRERESRIHFRSRDAASVLPVRRVEIETAFGTAECRSTDDPRWAMPAVSLLPADGEPAELRVTFWVEGALGAAGSPAPFSFLLELDAPPSVPPHWSSDAVADVAPPAEILWEYRAGPSSRRPLSANLEDGTRGLRRAGIVRFPRPSDWAPGTAVGGLVPYTIWARVRRATFSAPPRLRRIVPNAVVAAHERAREVPWTDPDGWDLERQTARWLPLPGRTLELFAGDLPLEDSVTVELRELDGEWHSWRRTVDFARSGPSDRVVVVDRARGRLVFGDGLNGRIPRLDADGLPAAKLAYLAGGGEEGELGSNLDWVVPSHADLGGVNPVPARGSRETESAADARARAARGLGKRERAVTADDYEELAITTPGVAVARAHAAVGLHPNFPCAHVPGAVSVFIVPAVPRGTEAQLARELFVPRPVPDPGALTEVRRRLDARRLITSEVFVRRPVYRRVRVGATLLGESALAGRLRARLTEGLRRYLDPLVGGDEATGWPFGRTLRPSELTHRLQALAGDELVVQSLSIALDGGEASSCRDVPILSHELVALETLEVEWRAPTTQVGGLR